MAWNDPSAVARSRTDTFCRSPLAPAASSWAARCDCFSIAGERGGGEGKVSDYQAVEQDSVKNSRLTSPAREMTYFALSGKRLESGKVIESWSGEWNCTGQRAGPIKGF